MLLNIFAQPSLLSPNSIQFFNVDEFKESPLLLCHKNALDGKFLPTDWSGLIYSTENIFNEIKQKTYNNIKRFRTSVLNPNEMYNITLGNDESQCKANVIEVTAIPWDKENLMYLIKADNVTNLLTDLITNDLEVFVQNKILRNAIKTGIDVLYVNDGIYNKTQQLINYPSECLLGTLLSIIQPHFVYGLSDGDKLPEYITNFCNNK